MRISMANRARIVAMMFTIHRNLLEFVNHFLIHDRSFKNMWRFFFFFFFFSRLLYFDFTFFFSSIEKHRKTDWTECAPARYIARKGSLLFRLLVLRKLIRFIRFISHTIWPIIYIQHQLLLLLLPLLFRSLVNLFTDILNLLWARARAHLCKSHTNF